MSAQTIGRVLYTLRFAYEVRSEKLSCLSINDTIIACAKPLHDQRWTMTWVVLIIDTLCRYLILIAPFPCPPLSFWCVFPHATRRGLHIVSGRAAEVSVHNLLNRITSRQMSGTPIFFGLRPHRDVLVCVRTHTGRA